MRRGILGAAVMAGLLVACEAGDPELPADARVRVDTVDGIIRVVSGNRGLWVRGGAWTVPDSAYDGELPVIEADSAGGGASPLRALAPDGTLYVAAPDRYHIAVLAQDGDTVRVLERAIRAPEGRPAIHAVRLDRDENLWVLTGSDPGWRHMEWAVHRPDGRYLGAVATPVMDVVEIGEDYVAGIADGRMKVVPIRK